MNMADLRAIISQRLKQVWETFKTYLYYHSNLMPFLKWRNGSVSKTAVFVVTWTKEKSILNWAENELRREIFNQGDSLLWSAYSSSFPFDLFNNLSQIPKTWPLFSQSNYDKVLDFNKLFALRPSWSTYDKGTTVDIGYKIGMEFLAHGHP